MTAIKKSTSKSNKSPTPATKTTPAAAAKVTPAAAVKSTRAKPKKPAAKGAPAASLAEPVAFAVAALTVATAPKPVAAKPVTTTITACIDVGFGNTLYVRGEGPGLSWDQGVLMECVSNDQWQVKLGESARPFLVKFLVNDLTWSSGPDYTVPSGVSLTLAPQF